MDPLTHLKAEMKKPKKIVRHALPRPQGGGRFSGCLPDDSGPSLFSVFRTPIGDRTTLALQNLTDYVLPTQGRRWHLILFLIWTMILELFDETIR